LDHRSLWVIINPRYDGDQVLVDGCYICKKLPLVLKCAIGIMQVIISDEELGHILGYP